MTKIQPSVLDICQILEEYRLAALEHRTASRAGNYKQANAAYQRLAGLFREIRARGSEAHADFLRLLSDKRIEVRGWAAAHALELAPADAEQALEIIAAGPQSIEELSARRVLQQWRSGQLIFP